jgi:hypothetical protein
MAEFIDFYIRTDDDEPCSTIIRIDLKQPIKLYDDEPHSPYRKAVARASRLAKQELGLHSCSHVKVEPDDWSDGVEELSERAWRGQQVPA